VVPPDLIAPALRSRKSKKLIRPEELPPPAKGSLAERSGEKWGWFIAIKRIGREYRLTPSEVVERFNINEFLTEIEYLDDEYKEQEKNIKNAKRNI
jgi:hypothetical protein